MIFKRIKPKDYKLYFKNLAALSLRLVRMLKDLIIAPSACTFVATLTSPNRPKRSLTHCQCYWPIFAMLMV